MAHLPVLEAYSDHVSLLPLGTPLFLASQLAAYSGGSAGRVTVLPVLSGPLAKRSQQGRPPLPQGWVFLVRAVHSPSRFSEPFASALISLEIDMLIFFCTILSTMSELIINI